MLVYLNRAFARAPIGVLNLRPLIVLSIITYLLAIVCIGQLRQERGHHAPLGASGVDASPIMSGDLEEKDGDGDEDEDSLAITAPVDKTPHVLVKRSEVQAPVTSNKVRSFAGSPAAASNLIGVGGSRPFDDDDDDDDDDDREDDDDDDRDDRDERNRQGKGEESTGGGASGGGGQTQANQSAPSLINRIMQFGGFGRAGGSEQQKNSQEPGNGARLFKLGLLIGR